MIQALSLIHICLILYLYTKGYRKFLFFVNQTNILEKTKENFLNPASGKYLFADNVEILGDQIAIREVDNFSIVDEQAINICFTTTQKLHLDLNLSKENSITIEDFEDDRVVLISCLLYTSSYTEVVVAIRVYQFLQFAAQVLSL